jgi:DNA-directed RNA polymerase subunit M/transcription elongation factor TFIIS
MKCPNCNFEVAENTKFCPECGTKMLEKNAETTSSLEATEEVSNAPSTTEVNEQKKYKKKKIKKIIIISVSALLACGIIFLVLYLLNPFCMFGHRNVHAKGEGATCTESGEHICDDCGKVAWSTSALGHDFYYQAVECNRCGEKRTCDEAHAEHEYKNAVCGKENTCVNCGEKEILQHELNSSYDTCCKNCGQDKFTVKLPTLPITVHEYNYSNNIKQSCTVVQMEVKPYYNYNAVEITFTVKSTYHKNGSNYSAEANFGWKLYDSDGTVVDSGTAYSDGTIKVGEQSKGDFLAYNLNLWETYRLEILNLS